MLYHTCCRTNICIPPYVFILKGHVTPRCDLPQNEKCECVDTSRSMLTADPTCVALALASAHFGGSTVDGSGRAAHETNQGCLRLHQNWLYTLAHCGVPSLLHSMCSLPGHMCIPGLSEPTFFFVVALPASNHKMITNMFVKRIQRCAVTRHYFLLTAG